MASSVLITGIGTASGFGIGVDPLWNALTHGTTCIAPITRLDPAGFPSKLAGELKDFSARDYVPKSYRKAVKVMARDIELTVAAALQAVEDAGVRTRMHEDTEPTYPSDRVGCHIGAGLIAAESEELARALVTATDEQGKYDVSKWGQGMNNLTPLWLLKYLPNMLACHVTIIHGAEGPSNTITCSEASSVLSIGESMRVIRRGDADVCFAGGAESKINHMGLLRMAYAGRTAPTGEAHDPKAFFKPYDPDSRGCLLGEGGGIFILEDEDRANERIRVAGENAPTPYARIAGFGSGHSDINYEDGEDDVGMRVAIESALHNAGLGPDEIDAIVPMGLGVPEVDTAEAGALRAIMGDRLERVPLVAVWPFVGNCVAGMGGIQVAAAALMLRHQHLPARLNTGQWPDDLLVGPADSTPAALTNVLVLSASVGGQNAALVLQRV